MPSPPSALQREIRQRRPFRSKSQEALLGLLKTADLVGRLLNETLEPYGVTRRQYNVLRILRGAGADALPTLAIRDRMIEQAPGVTRLLDRLEAKGWVRRRRCPEDRRQVLVSITEEGRRLLTTVGEPMTQAVSRALGPLKRRELDDLIVTLDRIRAAY